MSTGFSLPKVLPTRRLPLRGPLGLSVTPSAARTCLSITFKAKVQKVSDLFRRLKVRGMSWNPEVPNYVQGQLYDVKSLLSDDEARMLLQRANVTYKVFSNSQFGYTVPELETWFEGPPIQWINHLQPGDREASTFISDIYRSKSLKLPGPRDIVPTFIDLFWRTKDDVEQGHVFGLVCFGNGLVVDLDSNGYISGDPLYDTIKYNSIQIASFGDEQVTHRVQANDLTLTTNLPMLPETDLRIAFPGLQYKDETRFGFGQCTDWSYILMYKFFDDGVYSLFSQFSRDQIALIHKLEFLRRYETRDTGWYDSIQDNVEVVRLLGQYVEAIQAFRRWWVQLVIVSQSAETQPLNDLYRSTQLLGGRRKRNVRQTKRSRRSPKRS